MLTVLLAIAAYFAVVLLVLVVFRAAARADEMAERERAALGTAESESVDEALDDLARETRRGRFRRPRKEAERGSGVL